MPLAHRHRALVPYPSASMHGGDAPPGERHADLPFPRAGVETAAHASPPGRPCLLIVEDDPLMCKMLSSVLSDEYEVELANDARAAYDFAQRRSIALVVVDIHASDTQGLNLIYALRMDARTRHLPVVVLTASENRKLLLQCLAAGANNFLLKPFVMGDLRECVRAEFALAATTPRPRA